MYIFFSEEKTAIASKRAAKQNKKKRERAGASRWRTEGEVKTHTTRDHTVYYDCGVCLGLSAYIYYIRNAARTNR